MENEIPDIPDKNELPVSEKPERWEDRPRMLRSPATISRKDMIANISATTGIPNDNIESVFRAFNDISRNYLLDGFNVVLPFIGVMKIVKQYIPSTYNKEIVKKYGTIDIPKFMRKHQYTVLFGPMLKLHPAYRLLITDNLPTNWDAHNLKKMPFETKYKKFDFQDDLTDKIQEEAADDDEAIYLENNPEDDNLPSKEGEDS